VVGTPGKVIRINPEYASDLPQEESASVEEAFDPVGDLQ
jgi:hypothetical protein